MSNIKVFFSSPVFEDETITRRASLLSFITNLHLILALGVSVIYYIFYIPQFLFPSIALLSCLPALGVRFLLRKGKITLAAMIFMCLISLLMPGLAILGNVSVATVPITAFQFVSIVMAGLVLGGPGAFGILIITLAIDTLMLYAESNGWYLILSEVTLREAWIVILITYTAVTAMLWLANRLIQESFRRARHETEERRIAESDLQLAVEAAHLGTWAVDIASEKYELSNQLNTIYGGQPPDQEFRRVSPLDREGAQQAIDSLLSGQQERYAITHRILMPDGSERWVDSWGQLSRDKYGKPARIGGMVMDITDRKMAEQERERLIQELGNQNEELERFTYTVSHDLKSPLVTIRGFLGLLKKDAQAGNKELMQSDISRISDATDKMQRLLSELLELSRVGRMMNPPQVVPFETIVHEAMEILHSQIETQGVKVEIAPDMPPVYGDKTRLVEVVQNLMDNAIKFMGAQPQPRIEVGLQGLDTQDRSIFFIRDNGIGIEPQYHDKIFGLFNKLNPLSEGTGVGLALVKRIIEVHEGRVWVKSQLGEGTTFFFTLPTGIEKR